MGPQRVRGAGVSEVIDLRREPDLAGGISGVAFMSDGTADAARGAQGRGISNLRGRKTEGVREWRVIT